MDLWRWFQKKGGSPSGSNASLDQHSYITPTTDCSSQRPPHWGSRLPPLSVPSDVPRKSTSLPATSRRFEGFNAKKETPPESCSSRSPSPPPPPAQLSFETRVLTSRESLSKKERRELLKARVEALRERLRDSSSSSDDNNDNNNNHRDNKANRERSRERARNRVRERLAKFPSDDALHKGTRNSRPRTERYQSRRKNGHEDETPKIPVTVPSSSTPAVNEVNNVHTVSISSSKATSLTNIPRRTTSERIVVDSDAPVNRRPWSVDKGITTNGYHSASCRAPTPPPRSPKGPVAPPPPTRNRPVSYAFERPSPVYTYTDQAPRRPPPVAPHAAYLSDSQVTSAFGRRANFNVSPKPWNPAPPPIPPRRCSLHLPRSPPADGTTEDGENPKGLEDALQELERIYQSLRLKDDDLFERADRRELMDLTSTMTRTPAYVSGSFDSLVSNTRGPRLSDDLAVRRFAQHKTPPQTTSPPTPSYLRMSPAVSVEDLNKNGGKPHPALDDMAFRATRDLARTAPPHPPFGIPIQTAATSVSDYLRPQGVPKERSSFRPRLIPDPVTDDLAIRNLRRDGDSDTTGLGRRKFRATRSLSANLAPLLSTPRPVQETPPLPSERAQSLSDLAHVLNNLVSEPKPSPPISPPSPVSPPWVKSVRQFASKQHIGKALAGSVSDSDVRGRPMDEGRLDELLHSLAQGTPSIVQMGSNLSEEPGRKLLGRQTDSMTSPSDGRSRPLNSSNSSRPMVSSTTKAGSNGPNATGRTLPPTNGRPLNVSKASLESSKGAKVEGIKSPTGAPWRGTTPPADGKSTATESTGKVDRVNKYKEERRRQLASKYGDWSSSEDITNLGEEPSYMRFSRRQKKNGASETSESGREKPQPSASKPTADEATSPTNRCPDPGGTESGGLVRTNRAARLRAMATNGSSADVPPVSPVRATNGVESRWGPPAVPSSDLARAGSLRLRGSASDVESSFLRAVLARRSGSFGSSSSAAQPADRTVAPVPKASSQSTSSDVTETPTGEGADSGSGSRPGSVRRLKDKSNKRKSNLNRALLVEESQLPLVSSPALPSIPAQLQDDSATQRFRRTRREGDKKGDSADSSLRSTEIVRSVQHKLALSETQGKDKLTENDATPKKTRTGAMRRPEIPEVFRRFPLERSPLTSMGQLPARSESEAETSAAGRIKEMTQLARETTAKVDTLTIAALHSDVLASSDSEPVTAKTSTSHRISDSSISAKDEKHYVLGRLEVPSGLGKSNSAITKKGLSSQVKSPEKKNITASPSVEKKLATESEDEDDEEYLTPTAESLEKSSSPVPQSTQDTSRPLSILKRRGSEEPATASSSLANTVRKRSTQEETIIVHEPRLGSPAPVSILRKKSSSDEGDEKTHSILRSKVAAESEEPASILKWPGSADEEDRKPILKKRASLEEIRDAQEPRPILKKRGSFEEDSLATLTMVADDRSMPRPILKSRRKSGEEMEMVEELVESDLRPILKNRRDSDDGLRPISILKSSSSLEVYDGTSQPHSILKARSLDTEEKSLTNLRLREESEERPAPQLLSILKTHNHSDSASASPPRPNSLPVSSENEDSDASVVLSPVLLPSILKKRPKEVHPLATPHTEITNLLKAHQKTPERKEAVVIDLPKEGEDGPRKSVAERISLMEYKLEVERVKDSGLLTPALCSLAGSTPPFDSGTSTPQCLSVLSASSLSDAQLLSRLEDVALGPRRFRRDRQGDRSRTQPVTLEEVEESNSLATVQSFRRLVMTRASFDAFQQREKEDLGLDTPTDHKTEYPQPFRPHKMREMRERGKRRTLPVTVEELADARREVSPVFKKKPEVVEKREDTDGSGSSGEEVLRLSVAAKASLFMKLEAQRAIPASPRRIGAFRRGLQRSQTQPVTTEELHEASKLTPNEAEKPTDPKVHVVPSGHQLSKLHSMGAVNQLAKPPVSKKSSSSSSASEDDPCQLSLAERVRLFDRKVQEERLSSNQRSPPSRFAGGHRRRGNASRYQTQPVTPEEVEQAMQLKTDASKEKSSISRSQELTIDGDESSHVITVQTESSTSSSLTSSPGEEEDGESKQRLPSIEISRGIETNSSSHNEINIHQNKTMTVTSDVECVKTEESSVLEVHQAIVHPPREPLEVNGLSYISRTPNRIPHSSNDEDSSSPMGNGSGREGKRIKNDAINRRRNAALRRLEDRRSFSFETTHEGGSPPPGGRRMHQRSNTSPLTKEEKQEAEEGTTDHNRKSIRERLEALQKSGEGWKKRVETKEDLEVVSTPPPAAGSPPKESAQEAQASKVRLRRRSREDRPNSITDRISLLNVSQEGWRQRVGDKDSVQFTVAGKMGVEEALQESPVSSDRVRRTPKASIFKSQTADLQELQRTASDSRSPHPPPVATVKRSKSMPSKGRPTLSVAASSSDADDPPTMVLVPKVDDESFRSFFGNMSSQQLQSQHVEVSEGGFEEVASTTHELLVQRRSTRIQSRRTASSRNPLKVLATRTDLQDEYVEVKTGVAEKELRRIKVEQIAKTVWPNKALSAIAGLASKEDFTNVELRKTSSASNPAQLLPYRDLMLLQVKGRRHVQTRLVAPCVDSINHGDNFILVTSSQVYNWIGEYSNVIERARAAEVTATIQGKKDLGCTASSDVIVIDEEKHTGLEHVRKFFQLLGGDEADVKCAGKPLEDEEYENAIIGTNMVYYVESDHLVPIESCWGALPRIDVLDSAKVLVFDFGSEMYVWHGKKAATDLRRIGVCLARELWEHGYDYSECDINPLEPILGDPSISKINTQRPAWAVFAKVNQHMETVLFREKFLDWPDMSRVIKVKKQDSESETAEPASPLCACDAKKMLELPNPAPDLILEGSHVGRGDHYEDLEEKRSYDITTRGIKVWHVLEYSHRLLPRESWGQFHSGDTYVVRWHYVITVAGRNLSGRASRHSSAGRERCAYFFWQGKDSTINEQGASALMTVELDEEKGPHVRVVQGSEPPAFLQLFDGTMIVYQGKREEPSEPKAHESSSDSDDQEEASSDDSSPSDEDAADGSHSTTGVWKLFMVRGEVESEICLVEIRPTMSALRSCSCFILVNRRCCLIYVWHGAKAPKHTCTVTLAAAENLRERRPREIGFDPFVNPCLEEIQEGQEPETFMQGMGDGSVDAYLSHLNSNEPVDFTPRLFYMSSVSGTFEATEILCSFRCSNLVSPLPFLQSELYKAAQPALFMLDCGQCIFLWQGWWPEATDDNENTATGSAKVRWDVDRRCAMETAIAYCKAKSAKNPPPAYVVSAGLEPLQFTNTFPEWEAREDVATLNAQDGRRHGDQALVQDVLSHLNRMHYTLEELQRRPLPEGVDPSRLESYLDADTFYEVLRMSKDEFYQMPAWKQNDHKKKTVLF